MADMTEILPKAIIGGDNPLFPTPGTDPDGSWITPFSLEDGSIIYGHRGEDGIIYDRDGQAIGKILD